MTKAEIKTFVRVKRAAVESLRVDYLETLNAEVKRAGSADKLGALLGRAGSGIRMLKRGSLMALKDCVEEIATKLYGWQEGK